MSTTLPPEPPLVDDLDHADLGAEGCQPPSPQTRWSGSFTETRATSAGVDARAVLWVPPPWRTEQQVKVVWRVTGTGPAGFVAINEEDHEHPPSWGPNRHSTSTFARPGDEWGTAFTLATEGCWELRVTRDEGSASIWVTVRNP